MAAAPELRDVDVPEPGPGEVLVKVGGAGACHSDLHVMRVARGALPYELPFTLGHENAGWVEALGAGRRRLEVGEAVAVYGPWGCGRCRPCRLSVENNCERAAELRAPGGGLGLDGGMAEYMLVPRPAAARPARRPRPARRRAPDGRGPDALPRDQARRSPLVPGSSAVVIGVGGLGHMAVQILRAITPARVIAVDIDRPSSRSRARSAPTTPSRPARRRGRDPRAHRRPRRRRWSSTASAATRRSRSRRGRRAPRRGDGHRRRRRRAAGTASRAAVRRSLTSRTGAVDRAGRGARTGARRPHHRARRSASRSSASTEAYERMREGTLSGRAVITPNG